MRVGTPMLQLIIVKVEADHNNKNNRKRMSPRRISRYPDRKRRNTMAYKPSNVPSSNRKKKKVVASSKSCSSPKSNSVLESLKNYDVTVVATVDKVEIVLPKAGLELFDDVPHVVLCQEICIQSYKSEKVQEFLSKCKSNDLVDRIHRVFYVWAKHELLKIIGPEKPALNYKDHATLLDFILDMANYFTEDCSDDELVSYDCNIWHELLLLFRSNELGFTETGRQCRGVVLHGYRDDQTVLLLSRADA